MKICGIIAEYNPFHRGHERHIELTREKLDCDYVVVCLGSHFTQRGEPALYSKWARARMALSCGADAVFELPAMYTARPADAFARGGVGVLAGVGVDYISFGCEIDDLSLIEKLAALREAEPEELAMEIRDRLDAGRSHARAWGEAVEARLGLADGALDRPNLALGVEYVRALSRYPGVQATPILRTGDHRDTTLGKDASAAAIRAAFIRGDAEAALNAIPEAARPFALPDALHATDDLLLYSLRSMSLERMAALPDAGEGLEHRLYRLCRETGSREALLEALKCKRYTRARLSRLLTGALLGLERGMDAEPPRYARLLGLRHGAEPLLRELSQRARIPIAADPTRLRGEPAFQVECRATDLWALLHDRPEDRVAGREFREKFVRVP